MWLVWLETAKQCGVTLGSCLNAHEEESTKNTEERNEQTEKKKWSSHRRVDVAAESG